MELINQFMKQKTFPLVLSLCLSIFSCNDATQHKDTTEENPKNQNSLFISTMQKHLDAVTNKDLETLKSTMSPNGEMQLILPGEEIMDTSEKFLEFHKEWFKDTTWTFETKIVNTDIGKDFGMAITEIIYREPNRDGGPYFNRMIVSYDLKKINGKWYIVKDHASSVEKSTD